MKGQGDGAKSVRSEHQLPPSGGERTVQSQKKGVQCASKGPGGEHQVGTAEHVAGVLVWECAHVCLHIHECGCVRVHMYCVHVRGAIVCR